ncbi:MAG: hypothetical protein WBF13_00725 [Candidatus Zixiibacteriota bacterium]
MKNIKNSLKSAPNIIIDIVSNLAFLLISILLLLALLDLFMSSWKAYIDKSLSKELLVFYLAAVGLFLSLASVSFSYAKVCNENDKIKIVNSGRWFFYGAILLIVSLLLNYNQIHVANKSWLFANVFRGFGFAGSIIFGIVAAITIYKGFKELIDTIFK